MLAVKRLINLLGDKVQNDKLCDNILADCYITFTDFQLASKRIQPTAKREGFSTVPDTTWADVGTPYIFHLSS